MAEALDEVVTIHFSSVMASIRHFSSHLGQPWSNQYTQFSFPYQVLTLNCIYLYLATVLLFH